MMRKDGGEDLLENKLREVKLGSLASQEGGNEFEELWKREIRCRGTRKELKRTRHENGRKEEVERGE